MLRASLRPIPNVIRATNNTFLSTRAFTHNSSLHSRTKLKPWLSSPPGRKGRKSEQSQAQSGKANTSDAVLDGFVTLSAHKKSLKRLRSSSKPPPPSPRIPPLPPVLVEKLSVPTADQYGLPFDPAAESHKILEHSALPIQFLFRKAKKGKHRYDAVITTPSNTKIKLEGLGDTREEAINSVERKVVCKLHQMNLLKDILPGGSFFLPRKVPSPEVRLASDAKRHVIDFAARHDFLPSFSLGLHIPGRNIVRAAIPELGFYACGSQSDAADAHIEACIHLKAAIEKQHEESGEGMILVQDFTTLNTSSAEKFVEFYCSQKGYVSRYEPVTEKARLSTRKTGGQIAFDVTLEPKAGRQQPPLPDFALGSLAGLTSSRDATGTRKFAGIAMMKKPDALAVAYLVAALALKKEAPDIWRNFEHEMKRGKGELLTPLAPVDFNISSQTMRIIQDSWRAIHDAKRNNKLPILPELSKASRPAFKSYQPFHELRKSEILQRRLEMYETDRSLDELRQRRAQLPMVEHRNEVLKMVNDNDVCVVVGATGSGKTTQLPQLILDELIRKGKGGGCNIICTQPRRIAAVSVAQRVAVERNERLQHSVGYSVRFDVKRPEMGGSIHYCTTGILLKQMQDDMDRAVEGISHIIVDEVHERDLNIDFLLVVLKQLMAERKAAGKPAIKVILMSATIDTTLFSKYFGKASNDGRCPHIEVPGRTFPVTTHPLEEIRAELKQHYSKNELSRWLSRESLNYIAREDELSKANIAPAKKAMNIQAVDEDKAIIDWTSEGGFNEAGELIAFDEKEDTTTPVEIMGLTIAHLLKTTTEGSILAFLPGLEEITALERFLKNFNPLGVDFASHPEYRIFILHSSIPQMQNEVFVKIGRGQRKIILATNIAETSITIPDVVYVVDSAKHRELQYDPTRKLSQLVSTWIAKSNAKQRAGRAGRVQSGHYYTMASNSRHESFEVSQKPEILRTDLQDVCLQIKCMGTKDVRGFLRRAIQPPNPKTVEIAIDELQALGALDKDENLTPLGRQLSLLPLSPSLGKMVVLGAIFKCLDPMVILAAASSAKSPFLSPRDRRDDADQRRARFAQGTGSDHLATIRAFQEWRSHIPQSMEAKQWAWDNFLHYGTLKHIEQVGHQIITTLEQAGIIKKGITDDYRGARNRFFGPEAENAYSTSQPLQTALATAGFYPNLAIRHMALPPRFVRTAQENSAEIHVSSIAAPRPASGQRYGAITRNDVAPHGTIYTYSEKSQGDGQAINLRSVSKTSHLAVILFASDLSQQGKMLLVDEWLRFWVPSTSHTASLFGFREELNEYLGRTFSRLGQANQRRLLGLSAEGCFLDDDKVRKPLVECIMRALDDRPSNSVNIEWDSKQKALSSLSQLYTKVRSQREYAQPRPGLKLPSPPPGQYVTLRNLATGEN